MGLRPFVRWDAEANPAKRQVCLFLVSVVYSNHCALKARAGFRSIDRMGRAHGKQKCFLSLNSHCTSVGNGTVP